jgi:aspartate/methionine/tyrosine aminotransferase
MLMNELLDMADDECRDIWENLSLAYPFWVQGHPLLRQLICGGQYEKIDVENINCLAPQEGIYCTMQALLQPGDHVVVAAPIYQSLSEVPRSIGCEVDYWLPELLEEDGVESFRFDPSRLEALLRSGRSSTKLVVVNFPHNPTGALPTADEWAEMVRLCEEHGTYLFCDEMYRLLEHDSSRRIPAAADIYERGVSVSGLSKAYGLPGLRLGWVASQDQALMKRVQEIKDYTTICTSAPNEALGIIALRNADQLLVRSQSIVEEGKREMEKFFAQHDDVFRWAEPHAGTFAFPQLCSDQLSSREYCDELVEHAGIMLLPSSLFEWGDSITDVEAKALGFDRRFRVTYGRRSTGSVLRLWHGRCF